MALACRGEEVPIAVNRRLHSGHTDSISNSNSKQQTATANSNTARTLKPVCMIMSTTAKYTSTTIVKNVT